MARSLLDAGTKHGISWLIGKLHVSEPDQAVRDMIRKRAEGTEYSAPLVRAMERYAVRVHRRNRAIYTRVMMGY